MQTRYFFAVFWMVLVASFSSCGNDERDEAAIQVAIQEALNAKIAKYESARMRSCQEDIWDEANIIVDSILLMEARESRDSLGKPPRPEKPEKPEIKTIIDSLPIEPLLKDSINILDSI